MRKLMLLGTQPRGDPDTTPEVFEVAPNPVIKEQIAANTAFVTPLDPDAPFAHLQLITQPTVVVNGVNNVMIATTFCGGGRRTSRMHT